MHRSGPELVDMKFLENRADRACLKLSKMPDYSLMCRYVRLASEAAGIV